jgi:hypothetical protein
MNTYMLLFIFFVFGLFEWMQVWAGFLSFVCIPLNGLTPPPFCVCPNQGEVFFNPISHGLFSCLMIWDERWLSFFVMGGTVYHHFLYFLFITLEPNWISDWQKDYAYHSMIWHVVYINNQLVEFTSSFRDDPALKQSGLTKIGLKQMRP